MRIQIVIFVIRLQGYYSIFNVIRKSQSFNSPHYTFHFLVPVRFFYAELKHCYSTHQLCIQSNMKRIFFG